MVAIQKEIEDLYQQINEKLVNLPSYPAEELGLDRRCGRIYVSDEGLWTLDNQYLDYYGGFEYVDDTMKVGNWKFYSKDSQRVLVAWEKVQPEEEDVDSLIAEGERNSNEIDLAWSEMGLKSDR